MRLHPMSIEPNAIIPLKSNKLCVSLVNFTVVFTVF